MTKTKRFAGGVTGVLVLFAASASAQTPSLTLHIENQAEVQDDVVADAEQIAIGIYRAAGVDARFVDGAADVMIRLLSRHAEERMRRDGDAVGFTPCSGSDRGRIAYVFQSRVDRIAAGYSTLRAVVLGAAIAHEVGHTLLPLDAHSKMGIMQATWNQVDFQQALRGKLLFTPQQVATIRTRLMDLEPVASR